MLTPESSSPAARSLLEGVDSIAAARARYPELPEAFRAEVDSISPSRHIDLWSPNTVMRVMHDQGDPLIPVGESRRMVQALQQQRPDVPVYYTRPTSSATSAPTPKPISDQCCAARSNSTATCTTSSPSPANRDG